MTNAILVVPLLMLLCGGTVFGDVKRNYLVVILVTFGWFLMAGWSMATSESTWDAYWIIAILSAGMAIVTAVWPIVNRPKELPKDEELTEEDRAWGGTRKGRKKRSWEGDD